MGYDNVKLWFAKNEYDEIVTIDDLRNSNTYLCPVCGSDLIPKATTSKRITPHFAHIDKTKCSNESMMHFLFKHKFLESGDTFKVITDKEHVYVCKYVLVEQQYAVDDKIYRPDVTVITECGKTIYFEMKYSNKKEVKDYINIWLELKNIVVEIDIKQLMNKTTLPSFKALFYDGKCFNTKKNDTYYNTIGKYKEDLYENIITDEVKERINNLDWFWRDILRFNKNEVSFDYMFELINSINYKDRNVVNALLKKSICSNLSKMYKERIKDFNTHYFNNPLGKDHLIKKAVRKLDNYFKNIDKNYKVSLLRESNQSKAYSWYKGRKRGYWRTDSYNYDVSLSHKLSDYYLKHAEVINLVLKLENVDEIFNYYVSELEVHEINVNCADCESDFKINSKEVDFYRNKKLNLPKRCKSCRNKRKHLKGEIK